MDATQWDRIQNIFHDALLHPKPERNSYVTSECEGDEALTSTVLAMLAADQRESVLDRGLPALAAEVVNCEDSAPVPAFGPYRLQKLLGEGGMGAVWLAEREDTHSLVAVKILPHAALSPARRERFEIEIRTLARLKHSFIAMFHDAGTFEDGTPWFVMEYVEGTGLKEYCQGRSLEDRLRLFRGTCEAVQYAHAQGILHRDLKPSNILVQANGTPKLLDFGVAKELERLEDSGERTRPALRFVSKDYAAPEWVRDGIAGVYTDVYSLGVILYEMLAGRPPQSPKADVFERAGKASAAGRLTVNKSDGHDLDCLCLKAMHADPQQRYATVEALIRDVDHYLNGEPLEARPDGVPYRVRKFIARNRVAVLASTTVLLAVIALVAFFTVRLARERNTAVAEAARTRTISNFMKDLLSGGDTEYGPAKDLTVVAVLNRGLRKAHMLDGDPAAQAELYNTLADSYTQLGEYDKADTLFETALKERTRVFGNRSREAADSLLGLGTLRVEQGEFRDAEAFFREGLATAEHVRGNEPQRADLESGLGVALMDEGSYAAAIELFNRAIQQQQGKPDQIKDYADNITDLSSCNFYLGHYSEAESFSQRAVALDRQLYPEDHVGLADDLINLANIDHNLMRYADAERILREALAIERKWRGEHHPETADFARTLAQTLEREGKFEEASLLARQAAADLQKTYGSFNYRVAMTIDLLGRLAADEGNVGEAKTDFERTLAIYRSIYRGKHYYLAVPLGDMGDLLYKLHDYGQAANDYREALSYAAQSLPADHPLVGQMKIRLGKALLRQGNDHEAEPLLTDGYRILLKQTNAAPAFFADARDALAELHSQQRAAAESF